MCLCWRFHPKLQQNFTCFRMDFQGNFLASQLLHLFCNLSMSLRKSMLLCSIWWSFSIGNRQTRVVLLAGFSSLISSRVISLSCGNKSPMELVSSSKNCAQHLAGNPSYRMLYFLPSTPSIRLCLSKSQLAISSSMLFSVYKLMTN